MHIGLVTFKGIRLPGVGVESWEFACKDGGKTFLEGILAIGASLNALGLDCYLTPRK